MGLVDGFMYVLPYTIIVPVVTANANHRHAVSEVAKSEAVGRYAACWRCMHIPSAWTSSPAAGSLGSQLRNASQPPPPALVQSGNNIDA